MYGIEDDTGNVDVWNYGELFGAIDVAVLLLLILPPTAKRLGVRAQSLAAASGEETSESLGV